MATKTEKVTTNLSREILEKLDQFAASNSWSRSTAILVLIERGLPVDEVSEENHDLSLLRQIHSYHSL